MSGLAGASDRGLLTEQQLIDLVVLLHDRYETVRPERGREIERPGEPKRPWLNDDEEEVSR